MAQWRRVLANAWKPTVSVASAHRVDVILSLLYEQVGVHTHTHMFSHAHTQDKNFVPKNSYF